MCEICIIHCHTEVYKAKKGFGSFLFFNFPVYVYLNEVSVCDQGVCYPEEMQKSVVNMADGV